MANLREIKKRMGSVQATRQITRTMEMVSTAKIRRALERAKQAEPYKDAIKLMLANVASAGVDAGQPLLVAHDQERSVLFVLIASDRGLAGGFNIMQERYVLREMGRLRARGVRCSLVTCGKKPTEYFRYRGEEPVMSFVDMSSEPTMDEADRIASYAMDGYVSGKLDRVTVVYQHAKNRVDQTQVVEDLLPISAADLTLPSRPRREAALEHVGAELYTEFEFEPSASKVLGYLMPAYIRTVVYHALLDSAAAEHGARRRAMKSATDNANEVITNLSRTYNKVRQGSITTELNEIIGGASALEDNNA